MFGVTLWEMFTYGQEPWIGLNGSQVGAHGAHGAGTPTHSTHSPHSTPLGPGTP